MTTENDDTDERDMRKIVIYDDEVLQLMQGWTGGETDPLYAISSTGGWNYAWVFSDAIANIDRDLSRVKKLGRNKYQLGKGTFNKAEIDELAYIRDELQMALDDPESVMVDEARGRRVAAQSGLIGPGSDGLYKYRGASIEVSGWPGHYRATVRFRAQQYDFTSLTQDGVLRLAQQQIDEIAGTGVRASHGVAAHRDPADEQAATELVIYIENESDLSPDGPRGQGQSVRMNALKKWRKGTYDPVLGVKLFEYLAEAGAKRYAKEFSVGTDWSTIFNPATRHEAARQLEASFRSSVENGEYDREAGVVRDYEAIDRRDRVIAGPFKHYSDAKDAAGPAGAVRFVPSRGKKATAAHAPRQQKPEITYIRMGTVERGPRYERRDGYSENGNTYPWLTKREAQADAKNRGATAKFIEQTPPRLSETRAGAKEAGAAYAQDQIGSDHFMDWVRDQMLEASKSPPDEVLPLETKSDALKVARNMLQQLEWDTRRELRKDEITDLIGANGDVAEFWEGFREATVASREWLADELLEIKGGGGVGEARVAEGDNPNEWMVRYIHKISPSDKDVKGPVTIPGSAFSDSKKLGAALRRVGVLDSGARVQSFRAEGDRVIVFPSMPGMTTYWHSIILTHANTNPNAREATHRPKAKRSVRRRR